MSRGALKFNQRDVTRGLKGAAKAGVSVSHFEYNEKTGNLTFFTGKEPVPVDDLDRELAEFEAKL
jgi:hypothetical protein